MKVGGDGVEEVAVEVVQVGDALVEEVEVEELLDGEEEIAVEVVRDGEVEVAVQVGEDWVEEVAVEEEV